MSSTRKTKKGYHVWIPGCEDATNTRYTKRSVRFLCLMCRCCSLLPKRAWLKPEEEEK